MPCLVSPRLSPDITPCLLSAPAALSHSHNSPWKLFCCRAAKRTRRIRAPVRDLTCCRTAASEHRAAPGAAPQPLAVLGSAVFPRALQSQPGWKALSCFLFPDRTAETTAASGAVQSVAQRALRCFRTNVLLGPRMYFCLMLAPVSDAGVTGAVPAPNLPLCHKAAPNISKREKQHEPARG